MAKAKKTTETPTPKKPSTRAKSGAAAAPAMALSQVIENNEEQVRRRAYELYLTRNGNGGTPEEDWYRAEAELRGKSA